MRFPFGLFEGAKEQCPRCVGKGRVELEDIKRLGKQLKWLPGPCAYCNGNGVIGPGMTSKVPVDTTYLTNDIPVAERKLLFKGDSEALQRARAYDMSIDALVQQIRYLHFKAHLDAHAITEFYQISYPELRDNAAARMDFIDYVERAIR